MSNHEWLEEFVLMRMVSLVSDYDGFGQPSDSDTVSSYPPSEEDKGRPIYRLSSCHGCKKYSLWVNKKLVYPQTGIAPPPNRDLPKNAMKRYKEAMQIVSVSPAAAAALLRCVLESICDEEEEEKEETKEKKRAKPLVGRVKNLIERKKLSPKTGEMLHLIREVGNEGAHSGVIDFSEKKEEVNALFYLVNYVAEQILTSERHLKKVKSTLKSNKEASQ